MTTNLLSQEFDADDDSYTTSSFTSTANVPLAAYVFSSQPTPSVNPTLTYRGLTWTLQDAIETDSGTPRRYVAAYLAYPTTTGSGTMVVDFGAGNTQSNCTVCVSEVTTVDSANAGLDSAEDRGNASGSVAVAQGSTQANQTVTLVGAVINNNTGLSPGSGWTALGDDFSASPVMSWLVAYKGSIDTTADFLIDGATNRRWAAVMLQLGTQAGGGGGGSGGGGGGSSSNPGAPPIITSWVRTPNVNVVPDGDTATLTVTAIIPVTTVAVGVTKAVGATVGVSVTRALNADKLQYLLTADKGVITQTAEDNVWEWTNA